MSDAVPNRPNPSENKPAVLHKVDALAKKLRNAYGQAHGNRDHRGEPHVEWDCLTEHDTEKNVWRTVANAAIEDLDTKSAADLRSEAQAKDNEAREAKDQEAASKEARDKEAKDQAADANREKNTRQGR